MYIINKNLIYFPPLTHTITWLFNNILVFEYPSPQDPPQRTPCKYACKQFTNKRDIKKMRRVIKSK